MARPTVVVDGSIWKVYPTGRIARRSRRAESRAPRCGV